jgi:hypothetical protein
MQITLDPFNWNRRKLTRARTALDYFLWWKDEDGSTQVSGIAGLDCHELGWHSDSAIEYFEAARSLNALLPHLNGSTRRLLDRGLCRIITETPIDEFGTGDVSDGCYWLSASPRTTASILRHSEATDVSQLHDLHRSLQTQELPSGDNAGRPSLVPYRKKMGDGLERMISQHLAILRAAVSREFGLLGHCG